MALLKFNWIAMACVASISMIFFSPEMKTSTPSRGFTLLATLGANSSSPASPLVQAASGRLYGTSTDSGPRFAGSVFTVTPSGTVTVLGFLTGAVGAGPSGLIQVTDSNLYGTANRGGTYGYGSVIKLSREGKASMLYSFCPKLPCPDGKEPVSGVVQASDGNLYGTAGSGTGGVIYQITRGGALTVLHQFSGPDGAFPSANLIQGSDGNLYGTTGGGGANLDGTVFKITTGGTLTTLHSFDGSDGSNSSAALVQGPDGNFYGSTAGGGNTNGDCQGGGCGTIFKIASDGSFTTLHKFSYAEGHYPNAALVQADGNFYGTTPSGGTHNAGTIFTITPSGVVTFLHSFCSQQSCADGNSPTGLVQDTNGAFYGTTFVGGANNDGVVYSLSLGLTPFVKTLPVAASVGTPVTIIGTNLTGTSSVTFNGIQAAFAVESPSRISTSVPTGATTGTVQVVTPGGTLSSNVPFQVLP